MVLVELFSLFSLIEVALNAAYGLVQRLFLCCLPSFGLSIVAIGWRIDKRRQTKFLVMFGLSDAKSAHAANFLNELP